MPAVDATHLWNGLYQGSRPPVGPWVRRAGFDVLVLAADEYQPHDRSFPGVAVIHAPLDDGPVTDRSRKTIRNASRLVHAYLARGKRVLVTCHMGLNRSGIISAASMRRATGAEPMTIVSHIRSKRGGQALSNEYFVESFRRGEFGGTWRSR
jgi:protein-tyrosine phosphatase